MNESNEPTYTLQEARRVFALRECANYGHEWDIVSTFDGKPVRIACASCGWSGTVDMGERPKSP